MNTSVNNRPSIVLCECKSSQIHAHGHCAKTNTLALQFKKRDPEDKTKQIGGTVYHYSGFSAADYEAFTKAESLGKHFGAHIKDALAEDGVTKKYPHVKIEPEQPAHDTQ